MEIKELQEFAKERGNLIVEKLELNKRESILAHSVKLGEELGELNEEVLKYLKFQMKDKIQNKNDLEYEFADVIIVVAILAESMGVDMEKVLKEKMEILKERDYN